MSSASSVAPYVHASAHVSAEATIGPRTKIWHEAQVREGARLGADCIVGKGAYIDHHVVVGSNVKVQNRASVYHGVEIEDGVFVGPHVVFTNDRLPRAINADGSPKADTDWEVGRTLVRYGASIGANSTILPGVTIGQFALVGAGSLVTRDVPDFGLVVGHPARLRGHVCACGERLPSQHMAVLTCGRCGQTFDRSGDAVRLSDHQIRSREDERGR